MELKNSQRIDDLEYKGLKIIQDKDGFCFGIDSVLLANYAKNIKKDSIVADLGTGTGIIGILLCAKTKLKKIYGIEIQEEVVQMAKENVVLNNLNDKFEIINCNIKDCLTYIDKNSVDVIVTNPPYKKMFSGLTNVNTKKLISRHEVEATLEDFLLISSKLLKENGEIYMVHKPERLADIFVSCRKYGIEVKNMRLIHSKQGREPSLVLIQGKKNGKPFLKIESPLYIYNENGEYSDEILEIYERNDSKRNANKGEK